MYRDSPERLCRMDYCNEIHDFINYTLSNPRILVETVLYVYKKCNNKNFLDPNIVMMHLLPQRFMERYLCWFAHGEPYVPYKTIV